MRLLSQGGNPPVDPPIFSLSQGGNPPLDPPIFSLSQGGHPPVDPPYVHLLYTSTVPYSTVLYIHGTVYDCTRTSTVQ